MFDRAWAFTRRFTHRESVNDAEQTQSQTETENEEHPIRTALLVGALAVLLLRQQKSLWRQAKAELDDVLERSPIWMRTSTVESWAARWTAILRSNRPNLTMTFAAQIDKASGSIARQVNRQLATVDRELTRSELDPAILRSTTITAGLAATAVASQFRSQIDQVLDLAQRAQLTEQSTRSLLTSIGEVVVANRRQALRTALDLTGSQVAGIQREAFDKAGIKYAIWRTQGDSRVRPKHRIRNGKRFDVAKGADGIWPGQERGCRCWAEPTR